MSQKDPLVSIIIPTFNRAAIIEETLMSIQKQSFENWECLIVDDGSTDETEELVHMWAEKDKRFKFLKRPIERLKGANSCRNYGLYHSLGAYINFFDSDDLMVVHKLALDIELIKENEIDFTISQTHFFYSESKEFFKYWNAQLFSDSPIHDFITQKIGWSTNAPLWKKSSLVANNLRFDETLKNGQDYLFHSLALIKGMKPAVHEKVFVHQREHLDKIEHQIIKAPGKAHINRILLEKRTLLEPRTVEFLKRQSIRILSSLYKHKMWVNAVKYSWGILQYHSVPSFFTIAKLALFGSVYRLSGVGYSLLAVSRGRKKGKSKDKA